MSVRRRPVRAKTRKCTVGTPAPAAVVTTAASTSAAVTIPSDRIRSLWLGIPTTIPCPQQGRTQHPAHCLGDRRCAILVYVETLANLPILLFESLQGWEEWLDEHHTQAQGVWLKIAKKGTEGRSVSYAEALDGALC